MGRYIREHFGAVSLSVLLHAAIVLLLISGLNFSAARQISAPAPEAIEVVLVSSDFAPVAPPPRDEARLEEERAEQQRQEEARVERERLEERRQEQLVVEREREQREAAEQEAQRAEEARLALEREQREQADLLAAEQAERERQEAEQQQLEEERRLEEQRLAEQRRLEEERRREQERLAEESRREEERLAEQRRIEEARREQEARERALMEQELQRALAEEQAVMAARQSGEFDRYLRQIQTAIERAWIPPASARAGLECTVNVTQIPSGDVISVQLGACNGDDAVRRSIEAAVLRASPLPTPSLPALFDRNLQVIFRPEF